MIFAEPYPTPAPSPTSGILNQVTSYLGGLVPPGAVDSGIAVVFAVPAVILAALGYHHTRRGTWCSGWVSGPSALVFAVIAAAYGATGLPALLGTGSFDPSAPDPRSLVVSVVVAVLSGALVAGAAWPVAAHISAYRGEPTTLTDLREWILVERLPAAGGAMGGGALTWITLGPPTCVAGAVLGLLATVTVVTLRAAAIPAARSAPTRPPVAQPEPRTPAHPTISDEW